MANGTEESIVTLTRDLVPLEALSEGTHREERKMSHHPRFMATCCALLITVTAAATERRWTVTGQEVPELAALDDMIRSQMMRHDISASSIALTKNGRLVYARGYTWDQPDVEPVQPTSLFRTGSIAKSITSIAIHQLIEDGLLSYDTPVASTLGLETVSWMSRDPWLDLVTVDHLLTHTVGWDKYDGGIDPMVFRDWQVALSLGVFPPPTRREIATFMTGQEFQFYPGSRWAYCNFGYLLLQMLAEKVTGVDFPEYVHDNVFRAVGVRRPRMAHTPRSDLAPTERDYDGDYEGDPYELTWENAYAAGGMVMSAPDLARLYTALFDDPDASGLLEPDTLGTMLELPFPASADMGYGRGWIHEKFFTDSGHTVGWLTDPDDDETVYGHGGGGPGVHAIGLWRTDGLGFFWFSNKDPLVDDFDEFLEISSWPEHDLWESVGISTEPVGSAPVESWIPVVAHSDGVGGSAWRSDVGLLNRSPISNRVRLRYRHGFFSFEDRELELAPGAARTMSDVVAEIGEYGSGALQVFSSEPLAVTSRTYNQSSEGSYGQSLDGVTATGGLEQGESAVLMQLREDSAFRSNIGVHNQWRRSARVEIELYSGDGSLLASFTRWVPPQTTVQINRPFRTIFTTGYAVITLLSGQDVYVYGSVVDNATDDPTTIPMKVGAGSDHQWIAAAASGEGSRGSLWRTDLCLLNRSSVRASVDVVFHSDDGDSTAMAIELDAGEQRTVEDVVSVVGRTGTGALEIISARPMLVASRTYNSSTGGTFGQYLDGVDAGRTARAGQTVWLPQLKQDDWFRSNIGILNTGSGVAGVTIRLFDEGGAELAEKQRRIGPGERLQMQEPFDRIAGRGDLDTAYATVTVRSGEGLIAYASVIDNVTNDPSTVTMKR
jgi:CubicO group peptidase (beta-lactamase class C family)